MGCSSLFSSLLILCCAIYGTSATLGVDVSTLVSAANFECLCEEGYRLAIIRAYKSNGQVDDNAVTNIERARNAGFCTVDVYMVPCHLATCGTLSGQVQDMVDALGNSDYDRIWLVIKEGQWSSSQSENQDAFVELLAEAESTSKPTGVFTTESDWNNIMGSGYTGGSSKLLWYACSDNILAFKDFNSFGGWNSATIKRFAQGTVCNVNVGKNFQKDCTCD